MLDSSKEKEKKHMKVSDRIGIRREIFTGKLGERMFTVRPITPEDVKDVLALQEYVMRCLSDKNLLMGETEAEILESIDLDFCVGVFDGKRIIAFSLMVVNRETPRNLGQKLGFPPQDSVYFDITFVHPDYRGMGLQAYFLSLRDEIARQLGAKLAFVTVSPFNEHSLKNVKNSGFQVYDRRIMYSGVDR